MTATVRPGPAAAKRAALYLRVSTGRQAEQDLSIPDQRRQAHAYCQARGYIAAAEFVAAGASATDDRRPEFQKMMDAAAAKPPTFDTIIVHSFSRFFRDQFQLEFYVRRLAKNGVRLVSITQDLYDAIENGLADTGDENLKGRLKELRTVRDAARSDADRAEARAGDRSSEITEDAIRRFAGEAKRRMRTADGGYRRHHLQALAQRIEVGDATIRITGTKSKLLRVLAGGEVGPPHRGAGHSFRSAGLVVETTANEVRTFVPNWLRG